MKRNRRYAHQKCVTISLDIHITFSFYITKCQIKNIFELINFNIIQLVILMTEMGKKYTDRVSRV